MAIAIWQPCLDALAARAIEAGVGATEAAESWPTDVRALVAPVIAVRLAPVTLPGGLDALAVRASEAPVVGLVDAESWPTDVRALVTPVLAVSSAPVAHPRGLDALAARASETGIGGAKGAGVVGHHLLWKGRDCVHLRIAAPCMRSVTDEKCQGDEVFEMV